MDNSNYGKVCSILEKEPRRWLVTGVAGFIGSNLLEKLLLLGQSVVGLDNFSTGKKENLDQVEKIVGKERWKNFKFVQADVQDLNICRDVCSDVDLILHQAAIGSVPRSIEFPADSHAANATGTLNIFIAAKEKKVKRVVYASSSAVYGDEPSLPKVESRIGKPLSPYAATKLFNEIYAELFSKLYNIETIGLRYFNVFGPRQDPDGPYAAVIPKWIASMLVNEPVFIYGDGETSRDFCYVANVIQANILAALTTNPDAVNRVYNIAVGQRTTLNQLYFCLKDKLQDTTAGLKIGEPVYKDFRPGDIRHSLADISLAKYLLGYQPTHSLQDGLDEALNWYKENLIKPAANEKN
ncbi:MAG: SDR family oxidoreductase [Verrucomicrobiia bacterium]